MPTADSNPKMRLRIMRGGRKLKAVFVKHVCKHKCYSIIGSHNIIAAHGRQLRNENRSEQGNLRKRHWIKRRRTRKGKNK